MVELTVRAAVVGDEPFLWRMLLEAAHAGDEVDGVEALKGVPELARYVDGWGRPSDLGVIATWHRAGHRRRPGAHRQASAGRC